MPGSMRGSKQRLDVLLMERGLCDSREQAKRLILAGEVMVGGHAVTKAGTSVAVDADLCIKEKPRFVGRGGLKLEGALTSFGIEVQGRVSLDIGSSTGGFTDCLLQNGAPKVYAIDVGTNQLVWKLRNDPRVDVREQFNARHLRPDDLPELADLIAIDVSFISLTKILPAAFGVLKEGGDLICLIKPQFELEREEVGRGGIVKDPALHEKAVEKIRNFAEGELQKHWNRLIESPITGTDGNREYLAWLTHKNRR
jgi:23S rRNA (cytidine1920-2'-O)/16S rRNA (cytidine1409-2'-O)-methyltransferase